jgi:excisionase family DNA binding protein
MEMSDRPLGPAELAKALGCSRHTVDCAIKDGTIPAARIGRRLFIPRRVATEILDNGRIPRTSAADKR